MPYKKDYNQKTVKKGASRTPMSVMGGQGKPVAIMPRHFMNKSTGHTPFPSRKKK
jgi:hypothetical protein